MTEGRDREEFMEQLASRLKKGEQEYGNKSFSRSLPDLTNEILQEYLDIAGWAYVQWAKVRRKLEAAQKGVEWACSSQLGQDDDCC